MSETDWTLDMGHGTSRSFYLSMNVDMDLGLDLELDTKPSTYLSHVIYSNIYTMYRASVCEFLSILFCI